MQSGYETTAAGRLTEMEVWPQCSALMVYHSPSALAAWVAMEPTRPEVRSHRFFTTGKHRTWLLTCCTLKQSDPSSSHYWRSEYDGDLQSQLLSKANEEDKNCSRALSVVSTVVRAAKDLLHRSFAVDGKHFFCLEYLWFTGSFTLSWLFCLSSRWYPRVVEFLQPLLHAPASYFGLHRPCCCIGA